MVNDAIHNIAARLTPEWKSITSNSVTDAAGIVTRYEPVRFLQLGSLNGGLVPTTFTGIAEWNVYCGGFTHELCRGYYRKGRPHREDGPALITKNGKCLEWYVKGKLTQAHGHRKDGKLGTETVWYNCSTGVEIKKKLVDDYNTVEWYNCSTANRWQRHRLYEPAIQRVNGRNEWWINGEKKDGREISQWCRSFKIDPKDYVNWTDKEKMAFKMAWVV